MTSDTTLRPSQNASSSSRTSTTIHRDDDPVAAATYCRTEVLNDSATRREPTARDRYAVTPSRGTNARPVRSSHSASRALCHHAESRHQRRIWSGSRQPVGAVPDDDPTHPAAHVHGGERFRRFPRLPFNGTHSIGNLVGSAVSHHPHPRW